MKKSYNEARSDHFCSGESNVVFHVVQTGCNFIDDAQGKGEALFIARIEQRPGAL